MKTRNDCEIACDCVKRANVVLHVGLCEEIFARKHTATHKPTSAQPLIVTSVTYIHTSNNRLWSPLAYGLGGNNMNSDLCLPTIFVLAYYDRQSFKLNHVFLTFAYNLVFLTQDVFFFCFSLSEGESAKGNQKGLSEVKLWQKRKKFPKRNLPLPFDLSVKVFRFLLV